MFSIAMGVTSGRIIHESITFLFFEKLAFSNIKKIIMQQITPAKSIEIAEGFIQNKIDNERIE